VKQEDFRPVFAVPEVRSQRARAGGIDVHLPESGGPSPAVVFVHGPVPAGGVRPVEWPVYHGYCALGVSRGLAAATSDLDYVDMGKADDAVPQLERQIESVRSLPQIDGGRIALWAFSGGGLLVNRWLADPSDWLRCVALSYPLLQPPPAVVSVPIVLTRVGRERPEIQETVDRFLAADLHVERIDVPNGRHAFDFFDDTDESRAAVERAVDLVVGHL
jgi:dienelactone hydrolase